MKKIIISIFLTAFLLLTLVKSSEAVTRVKGYFKSNGSYVQPYYRSSPNRIKIDNYSTKGNYNPYTGKKGYKKLY